MKSKALNTREAARYLADLGTPFSPGTMEVWRSLGRGPRYRRVCNKVVYDPADLDRFSAGTVVETTDSRESN